MVTFLGFVVIKRSLIPLCISSNKAYKCQPSDLKISVNDRKYVVDEKLDMYLFPIFKKTVINDKVIEAKKLLDGEKVDKDLCEILNTHTKYQDEKVPLILVTDGELVEHLSTFPIKYLKDYDIRRIGDVYVVTVKEIPLRRSLKPILKTPTTRLLFSQCDIEKEEDFPF